jgi:hypothetical protein
MPMDFINQNVLLIALVVISGLALLWPALVRPAGNGVILPRRLLLINRKMRTLSMSVMPRNLPAGSFAGCAEFSRSPS